MHDHQTLIAAIGPGGRQASLRAERLPQAALDILAWAFREQLPAHDPLPLPMSAAEVRLDDPLHPILHGGDGFRRHGGSDAPRYFTHRNDPAWAVVFAHDCPGDPERGARLLSQAANPQETDQ